MTRPVVHFQLRGRDPARLRDFYSQIFGWSITDGPMGTVSIAPGIGGPGELGGSIMADEQPRVVIFVQVLDLVETLARAESLGGRRVMEPVDVPGGPTIAQMADPEGNIVGLVQQ